MNPVLLADVFVIAGLIATVALIGLLTVEQNSRLSALLMLAIALTIAAAGRRFATGGDHDLLAWTFAALSLPRLWWPRRTPPGSPFAAVALLLGAAAIVLPLIWGSR